MSHCLLRVLIRRCHPLSLSYSTDLKPPIKVQSATVTKSKKAGTIKNLHRENKEMFGELLESKRDKMSREKKKAGVLANGNKDDTAGPSETVFVAVRQTSQGPKASRKNSDQVTHVPFSSVQTDPDISKHGDIDGERKTTRALEGDWMVKNFSKRTKVLSRIPPTESVVKNKGLESQLFSSPPKVQSPLKSVRDEMSPREYREIPTHQQFLASVDQCQDINHYGEVKQIRKEDWQSEGWESDRDLLQSIINENEQKLIGGTDETESSLQSLKPASSSTAEDASEAEAITSRRKKKNTSSSHDPFPSEEKESDPNPLRVSDDDMISAGYKLFPFDNPGRQTIDEDGDLGINVPSGKILSYPYPRTEENFAKTKIPSVTRILTATMSPQQVKILKQWEQRMIAELGEDGFKEYKQELFRNGKLLHSNLQGVLSGKSADEIEIPAPIQGHWKSLGSILKEIRKVSVLESYVSHPELNYSGIVDCVATYRDKLVLIDWKTSEKPKPFISNTYDTPLQIAAYIGAINYDPSYKFKVVEGLAVIAYKDGKDCQLFHLNTTDILKYWKIWLQRLKLYNVREIET